MTDLEQLRERLARVVADHLNYGGSDYVSTLDNDLAGNILDEIDAAGYVLMDRGRAERLRQAASVVLDWYPVLQDAAVTPPKPEYRLRPGDTDPLEGGE